MKRIKFLSIFLAVFVAIAMMPAAGFAKDKAAQTKSDHTITTKVTNGNISAEATVSDGGSTTVTYSPWDATDYYLYRVSVDGTAQYLDNEGDGVPEKGDAGMVNSYKFENVTGDHAIAVVYMPNLPENGVRADADIQVGGSQEVFIDPFKSANDLTLNYTASVAVPKEAQGLAQRLNQYITKMSVEIEGTFSPEINTANATMSAASSGFKVENVSFGQGTFKATLSPKNIPPTDIDWTKSIQLNIDGCTVKNADARANAGGELIAKGTYQGGLTFDAKGIKGSIALFGQSGEAVVKIANKYTVNHYVETSSGQYALKDTVISGDKAGTAVVPTANTYAGYSLNTGKSDAAGGTVKDDNSLVLNMYYDKNVTPQSTYTVKFNSNGGSTVASQAVSAGKTVTKPQDPGREGYAFLGWYTDQALTKAYNFSTAVDSDMTLYAKWHSGAVLTDIQKGTLRAKAEPVSGKKMKITWTKEKGAARYVVYGSRCNTKNHVRYVKKMKGFGASKRSYKVKIKRAWVYKYVVIAYDKDGREIARSYMAHAIGKNIKGKYGNLKTITPKQKKITLKAGKKKQLSAKVKFYSGKKTLSAKHAPKDRYFSTNKSIAKVTKRGKVTAVKKGKCTVYVNGINGKWKAIKVTVK